MDGYGEGYVRRAELQRGQYLATRPERTAWPCPGPDPACVALLQELSGSVQGTLVGNMMNGTATAGAFPSINIPFVGSTANGGATASGTWEFHVPVWPGQTNGLDAHGTWLAVRAPSAPALGGPALTILGGLLLGVGARWLRGRRRHA